MVAAIQLDHAINGSYDGLPVLAGVNVSVRSPDDELKFGVDESYKLTVPSTGSPLYARIEEPPRQTYIAGKILSGAFFHDCEFQGSANAAAKIMCGVLDACRDKHTRMAWFCTL
ncbi:beta-hexosaminidase 3-like isoform X2 [Hordeum vulgare subsp. vulgare]|uniref:beta-hexosaminidase 3-like isoform X2 n=1 Tax=Hordeum vulgare subsp. vulgare TaxID=112509 RepID=UPI001D1A585C|nr:beta-hexosaminidase 3-like isoform X2 [Hordeum vulgare subsp. vulgare]